MAEGAHPSLLTVTDHGVTVVGDRTITLACLPAAETAAVIAAAKPIFAQIKRTTERGVFVFASGQVLAGAASAVALPLGFRIHEARGHRLTLRFYNPAAPVQPDPCFSSPHVLVSACGVVLKDPTSDGPRRILMVRHRHTDGPTRMLFVPGGSTDVGESVAETALREVWEETGVRCRLSGLLMTWESPRHGSQLWYGSAIVFVFLLAPLPDQPTDQLGFPVTKVQEHEIAEAAWYPLEGVTSPDFLQPGNCISYWPTVAEVLRTHKLTDKSTPIHPTPPAISHSCFGLTKVGGDVSKPVHCHTARPRAGVPAAVTEARNPALLLGSNDPAVPWSGGAESGAGKQLAAQCDPLVPSVARHATAAALQDHRSFYEWAGQAVACAGGGSGSIERGIVLGLGALALAAAALAIGFRQRPNNIRR